MNDHDPSSYVPALRFKWLTKYYDLVVGLTTRERTFKKALLEQTNIQPRDRVLDLACGTGTLAIRCKEMYPTAQVVGVDGDKEILEIAAEKAGRANTTITLDNALSFALPYEDEEFDVVTSSLFFHHLSHTDKKRTVMEVSRVLKPKGRLHVADWGQPTNFLMRILFFFIQVLDGFENTSDNINGELDYILKKNGFSKVSTRKTFNTMFGTLALYECEKALD